MISGTPRGWKKDTRQTIAVIISSYSGIVVSHLNISYGHTSIVREFRTFSRFHELRKHVSV
jgi:hypothetical protein